MNWIKQKVDNYLLQLLGTKAIFDQEQTLEIKKKNDYYENKLALPEVLNQLSTPAPVVGDISTMTDPLPGVRLPRIPYYEYIYYLMRWNSSVLRMIGFKIKQEIFRETRLKGFEWEGKFKTKCSDCGTEFEEQLELCDFCNSKNVVPPDPTQKKLLDPFLLQANKAEQTLLEVYEETEDDFNTVDDAYKIFVKDYFIGPGGLFGKVKEIMRGDPSRFRIVSDISGRRGGKWWVCPAHREAVMEPAAYNKSPNCSICGLPCQEVHYVETTPGGITPAKYYIKDEVIHASKYEPSRLYGIPPMFSVYIVARTIQLMDLYTEEYYEKGRLKGLVGIATENKIELKKWWDEVMTRLRNDPHYVPLIALDVGPDNKRSRMEFLKLVDNMDELKFQEHRRMLKEEIAGLFGVNLIFLADTSTSGGLNNEGLQITVTDRTVEWGQSIYHDQFFPKLLEALNITDWKLKLKPSKETDEMAELERFDQRVETAGKLQQMGYTLELRDDKFEVKGKAHIIEKPSAFGNQFGSFPQQGGGSQRLLPAAQEGKPDKPIPAKEIKRSIEKSQCRGRVPTVTGFHPYYCSNEKMTFEFYVDKDKQAWYIGAKDEQGKDISRWVTLGNAKTAFGWYGNQIKDGRGKILKSNNENNEETEDFDNEEDLPDEVREHLAQAFSNPDNYVYVPIPDKTKEELPTTPKIQVFDMERVNDESGQSGTGIVLSGIIFQDGKVVVRWNTETASTTEFDSWEDFEAIHISQHPGNETKIHFYQLNEGDMMDFAKSVVEPGKDVLAEVKQIEDNFAKQLENIYLKKLGKKIAKLDDLSSKRLIKEIDSIVNEATPLIEKLAFSEVLIAYKKGKKIDESRDVSKTIDLPDNLTEPFKAEYGAFGLDKEDWQVLRAIYRRNPFWKAFEGMSQSVSDKLKEHITESYEAPNSARMKATIRDVKRQYRDISQERAEIIAYGRIGKFSIAKIVGMMKRTINAEVYRLERIARSETTAITAKGREIAFQQTDPEGLHKYRWFGPRDKRNSEECPEIKSRVAKEGKGRGVPLERLKEIQEEVVNEANKMRKTDWIYRDWLPHANCRHVIQRVV